MEKLVNDPGRTGWLRRRKRWLAGSVVTFWLSSSIAFAAGFTAGLDRDTVTVGESVTLTFTFEGGEPTSIPVPPSLPNLRVANQGVSRNFSVVNGHSSSTISESFELTPTQPGDYPIPSFKVEIDGQILTSQPLKLKALKAGTSAADDAGQQLAFLKILVPKREIYLGEVIEVQLQLFIRDGVVNADDILRNFENLANSPLKAEGFSILKTAHAQPQRVQIGNGVFDLATLVTSLSPVKTGPLGIEGINATLVLQLAGGNQRRDFVNAFFQRFQEKRVVVATDPQTLTILPLPPNAPADFNGAVGTYRLTAIAGPTNVVVGDPVTLKIQLSGTGAFDSLAIPEQRGWSDFKKYPPTSKSEPSNALGTAGTKTFEEVVVPQNPDIKELPPISFSYFDSDRRIYQTLTTPALALTVRPGGSTTAPLTSGANPRPPENQPPVQDIISLKQRPGELAQISLPLVEQPWFLGLQTLPVLAWLSIVGWRKHTQKLADNPRRQRQRQVARIVRGGLGELRVSAAQNKPDEFFAILFRLLQEKLGEQLDLPASAITEAVIEEPALRHLLPESLLNELRELFQICNLARYASVRSSSELAAFIPKIEIVFRRLEESDR